MTCDLEEVGCAYVSPSMSPDHQFYMLRCSGPDVPTDTLYYINGTQGMLGLGLSCASMSPDHQFYMLRCSGPDVPTDTLYYINGTQGTEGFRVKVVFL